MTSQSYSADAIAAFLHMVQANPGFRQRAGQHAMATRVAQTLSQGDLGEHPEPQRTIAVIQAGTGVGKSAAYASTAITIALARQTRVLISTATVALQEQLMVKDLPTLAASLGHPFRYALAKGRQRYVCQVKLERMIQEGVVAHDLFDADAPDASPTGTPPAALQRRLALYTELDHLLQSGRWDGDRDTLLQQPDSTDWAPLSADRHTCTVRHCPRFRDCSYYRARMRLSEADVIVANHDLLLASLGRQTLPALENCLLVLDEAHHLPGVARDQFAAHMDLSNGRWLEKLPRTMEDIALAVQVCLPIDVQGASQSLRESLQALALLGAELVADGPEGAQLQRGQDARLRFINGRLPDALHSALERIVQLAQPLCLAADTLGVAIKKLARDDPGRAAHWAQVYARLGTLVPRLNSALTTSSLLCSDDEPPLAKWLLAVPTATGLQLSAHASPMEPAQLLRQSLWSATRCAVLTSASLTSCGSFEYFLRECGLEGDPAVSTLQVDSPFDYQRQGRLTVVQTHHDPRQAQEFNAEMVAMLMQDLQAVEHGALVLFTSKQQMRLASEALPGTLRERVLVQGTLGHTRLLAAHQARVQAGQASILFGLQSFGEGLDLPGRLCETVFIAKLPFSAPSEPVDEARAEWLRRNGQDPFNALVVPATGMRLLQWTGRAIRSEDDCAQVVCYDPRLLRQGYGRRMLKGLPPYRLEERPGIMPHSTGPDS